MSRVSNTSISCIGTGCVSLVAGAVASMRDGKELTGSQEVRKEGNGVYCLRFHTATCVAMVESLPIHYMS